jgi:beta-1,3-N-acetylglucosaminyltransferase 5
VYGAGTAYVFSSEVADKVHEVSQALNSILYIDDVFMGLCGKKKGNSSTVPYVFPDEGKAHYHPCIYIKMMTSRGHVQYLLHLWKDATDPRGKYF